MSKWIDRPLGDVTSYLAKGIPPKYTEDLTEDVVYVLNQKCNRDFAISYDPARLHNLNKKKVADEKMLQSGDVLINSTGTGTAGRIAQIWNIPYPTTIDGHMILLRPTPEVDPLYYGYALKAYQAQIETLAEGSTGQTEINKKRLREEIIIRFPESKEEQRKVARVLENIDKKISVNERINRNLLEQAQIYYDELFIKNGKPEWKTGFLSDIGAIVAGGTPSKRKEEYYAEEGIAWITPRDLSNDHSMFISRGERNISELGYTNSSATKMPVGTVLFSSRAPIGYIAIAANEVTTNQGFKSIVPNDNVGTPYIFFLLHQLLPIIESMASGSTFKEISGAGMKAVPTVIPDNETLKLFNEFCKPLFRQIQSLETENKQLASLRDFLLPKLMSGELNVSNIDI